MYIIRMGLPLKKKVKITHSYTALNSLFLFFYLQWSPLFFITGRLVIFSKGPSNKKSLNEDQWHNTKYSILGKKIQFKEIM